MRECTTDNMTSNESILDTKDICRELPVACLLYTSYRISGLEEYDYPENEWDCVISNLALHYIEDLSLIHI